jgi:hypothetical protein
MGRRGGDMLHNSSHGMNQSQPNQYGLRSQGSNRSSQGNIYYI